MNGPPDDPVREPPALVAERRELAELCAVLRDVEEVALDTEANSLHAYRERTCIVQVTAGGQSTILDALALEDLEPLAAAIDRPDVLVVFHGGDYDVSMLTRDHDFRFSRVFDTMIAATLLGVERVGLADLVRERFGVELDKRFQKADWARRPLTPEQMDYLHRDTAYLPELRADFQRRLEEADLVEEAEIEFRRLAARRGAPAGPDPEGWRRIKGANRLDAEGRAVLERLHAWREAEAERRDVPPFKVLSPQAMLHVAERAPRTRARASDLLHPGDRRRCGREVDEAAREGLRRAAAGEAPPERLEERPSREEVQQRKRERAREEAIRAWRRGVAAQRGVPPLVILPNPALAWLVRDLPDSVDLLGAHPDIGRKRAQLYGQALLDVLTKSV